MAAELTYNRFMHHTIMDCSLQANPISPTRLALVKSSHNPMRPVLRLAVCVTLVATAAHTLLSKKQSLKQKKEEELPTQVLELPQEPPLAVAVDTARLSFLVSPTYARGLLSQQIRDALRALLAQAGQASIVKIRAFVAGSGDSRRVAAIVSETFTERRQPLPAVTTVQVGALPGAGVQVVLEAAALSRRRLNPSGLAWSAAFAAEQNALTSRMLPLVRRLLPEIKSALSGAGLGGRDALALTCYLSSLDDVWDVRSVLAAEFPAAVLNLVQPERAPYRSSVACEAVLRLNSEIAAENGWRAIRTAQPRQLEAGSDLVLVSSPQVILTGAQLAFGLEEKDAKLAFQRLERTLAQHHSSLKQAVALKHFVLSRGIGRQAVRAVSDFLAEEKLPTIAVIPCVGLPALDVSFAVEAVAVPAK